MISPRSTASCGGSRATARMRSPRSGDPRGRAQPKGRRPADRPRAVDCPSTEPISVAAAAAQYRLELAVGAEVVDALDRHQFGEPGARPINATLDGADRAAADAG